jgi:hypothetical protein
VSGPELDQFSPDVLNPVADLFPALVFNAVLRASAERTAPWVDIHQKAVDLRQHCGVLPLPGLPAVGPSVAEGNVGHAARNHAAEQTAQDRSPKRAHARTVVPTSGEGRHLALSARAAPRLSLPGILGYMVYGARGRREAIQQLASARRKLAEAEATLEDAQAARKQAEEAHDAASDHFDAAEAALDAAREERAQARTARYAARQTHERASTAVDRLQRRVRDLSDLLDRMAELARTRVLIAA